MHEDKEKILEKLFQTLVLTRAGWNLMDARSGSMSPVTPASL